MSIMAFGGPKRGRDDEFFCSKFFMQTLRENPRPDAMLPDGQTIHSGGTGVAVETADGNVVKYFPSDAYDNNPDVIEEPYNTCMASQLGLGAEFKNAWSTLDDDTGESDTFIEMEKFDTTLSKYIERRPISDENDKRVDASLSDLLVHLKANSVCHNDLHAGNVVITLPSQVKFIDWSHSKFEHKTGYCPDFAHLKEDMRLVALRFPRTTAWLDEQSKEN